jgi:tetratricopeptide (TPR) repeat protein
MQVVAALGEAHCVAAQYDRALPLLDRAIAVKREHRSAKHFNVGLAFSLVCRAIVLGDRGQFEESHAVFDEAIASIADRTHEIGATAHGWHSAVLLWQGRWAEARTAADESGRICEATRSLAQLSIARAMSAYADWMLTRRPDCLQTIQEAAAWLIPRGGGLYRSLSHGWLAAGLMDSGRREEARQHAAQALLRRRQCDLLGVAMSYRALARDAVDSRPQRVQHYLDQAFKAARVRDSAHEIAVTQLCAADIAWRLNQAEKARELLEQATAAFASMRMAWHLEDAARLRGLMDPAAAPACSA